MSSSCLKLLLALTLFVIITECYYGGEPCMDDDQIDTSYSECSLGFSCIKTKGKAKCVKSNKIKSKPSKYKNTD